MKALGIEKAHLCGLSMGATAGIECAIRHPGKATALVIAAGGGGGATDPEAKKRFKEECEGFARRIEQEGMPTMAELYCASSARNSSCKAGASARWKQRHTDATNDICSRQ